MVELHRTEVDQVTTIWVDAPPPLRAGLLFRTGQADETLATSGQTHLIEHLAFSTFGEVPPSANGWVGGAVTGFFKMGHPREVSAFLAAICDALVSLPGDRLASEKQVLAAETATRPYDVGSDLLKWRYGTAGYGLLGLPQFGIRRATFEELLEFSAQRFTKENAVLWLSGPPPAGLSLGLPHGTRQPLPPLEPVPYTFPCWFADNKCGGIAVGASVPRVSAASIFCEIASRRLHKRLRTDLALSYAPFVAYDPLNADTAHLVLYADSEMERRAELAEAFGEVFYELVEIEEPEVEAARRQVREAMIGAQSPPLAERMVLEAQRAALDWILGKDYESSEVLASRLEAMSVNDVVAFASELQATAIFALPGQAAVRSWFGQHSPHLKVPVVRGSEALNVDAPIIQVRLRYGPDGVSLLFPNGYHSTVRYSMLAGALFYEDGCVWLIGRDAAMVTVEPTLWRAGQSVCQYIRDRVPGHLVIDRRSRPADEIPQPETTAWQRFIASIFGAE